MKSKKPILRRTGQKKSADAAELPAAVKSPTVDKPINLSLHPIMSFEFSVQDLHGKPTNGSIWRWSWGNEIHFVKITNVTQFESGGFSIVGGIYIGINPGLADLPEAVFLRGIFDGPTAA